MQTACFLSKTLLIFLIYPFMKNNYKKAKVFSILRTYGFQSASELSTKMFKIFGEIVWEETVERYRREYQTKYVHKIIKPEPITYKYFDAEIVETQRPVYVVTDCDGWKIPFKHRISIFIFG